MAEGEVRMRLIRADDAPPTNPLGEPFAFGLQDTKQQVFAGNRDAAGRFVFDFSLTLKPGKDPERPSFGGPFASGPADDRFVYLAWRSIPRGVWINRIKARLSSIDWPLVRAAQAADRPLVADVTGRRPHDTQRLVDWRLDKDG
jgi:hypothetical protein